MGRVIVVLARRDDIHADAVIDHCRAMGGNPVRIDPASLPTGQLQVKLDIGASDAGWELRAGTTTIASSDDYFFFCREWQLPSISSSDDLEKAVAIEESNSFLQGWAGLIANEKWMDHPFSQMKWDNKILQLWLARSLGFGIPRTIVTNSPECTLRFVEREPSVVKQLSNFAFDGLENDDEFIFTTPLAESDLAYLGEVASCPTFIQSRIEKLADIRVTVVGRNVFSAIIKPTNPVESEKVDFRTFSSELIKEHTLPPKIKARLLEMMRVMELRFGAFDLGLTATGDYVFFEVNVVGNWLWIEHATGFEISKAIASELIFSREELRVG